MLPGGVDTAVLVVLTLFFKRHGLSNEVNNPKCTVVLGHQRTPHQPKSVRGGGLVEDVRKGNTYWQADNYPWITPGFDHELAIPRQEGVGRDSGGCSNEEAIANGIVQVNAPLNEGTKKAPPGGEAEIKQAVRHPRLLGRSPGC